MACILDDIVNNQGRAQVMISGRWCGNITYLYSWYIHILIFLLQVSESKILELNAYHETLDWHVSSSWQFIVPLDISFYSKRMKVTFKIQPRSPSFCRQWYLLSTYLRIRHQDAISHARRFLCINEKYLEEKILFTHLATHISSWRNQFPSVHLQIALGIVLPKIRNLFPILAARSGIVLHKIPYQQLSALYLATYKIPRFPRLDT